MWSIFPLLEVSSKICSVSLWCLAHTEAHSALLVLKTTKIVQTLSRYRLQRSIIVKEFMAEQFTWMTWKMSKFLVVMSLEITMLLKMEALLTLLAQKIKTTILLNVLWKYLIQSFMGIQLSLTVELSIGIFLSLQCRFKNPIFRITKLEFTVMTLQASLKG